MFSDLGNNLLASLGRWQLKSFIFLFQIGHWRCLYTTMYLEVRKTKEIESLSSALCVGVFAIFPK